MADQNETPQPNPPSEPVESGGILQIRYIRSPEGILNIIVVASLLLGFICAVSLSHSGARQVDICDTFNSDIKINVAATRASYAVFSFLGFIAFSLLLIINILNLPFLGSIKDVLSSILSVMITASFMVLMFIVSSTAAAAERKRAVSTCNGLPRSGGLGAASVSFSDITFSAYFHF
ncbi:hypothetical protein ACOME3_009694 [Neoechinorhynchus agilis]